MDENKKLKMERMSTSEVRRDFSDVINRVANGNEEIIIHRRGKDMCAIVSMEVLELIERIEDEIDIREAEKILARNEPKIPWDKAMEELGLEP